VLYGTCAAGAAALHAWFEAADIRSHAGRRAQKSIPVVAPTQAWDAAWSLWLPLVSSYK